MAVYTGYMIDTFLWTPLNRDHIAPDEYNSLEKWSSYIE